MFKGKLETESCEICDVEYDCFDYIPKELPCCKKAYCVKCLIDWKKRKDDCPNCRKKIEVNLESLEICAKMFRHKCPNCQILTNQLYFMKDSLNKYVLGCLYCEDGLDSEKDKKFEFNNFFENFFQFDSGPVTTYTKIVTDSLIEKLINEFKVILKNFTDNLLKNFKEKITLFVDNEINGEIEKNQKNASDLKATLNAIQSLVNFNKTGYDYHVLLNLIQDYHKIFEKQKESLNYPKKIREVYKLGIEEEIVSNYFLENLKVHYKDGYVSNFKERNKRIGDSFISESKVISKINKQVGTNYNDNSNYRKSKQKTKKNVDIINSKLTNTFIIPIEQQCDKNIIREISLSSNDLNKNFKGLEIKEECQNSLKNSNYPLLDININNDDDNDDQLVEKYDVPQIRKSKKNQKSTKNTINKVDEKFHNFNVNPNKIDNFFLNWEKK